MLKIVIPAGEIFDEKTEEFKAIKETELTLEHSLISLSKWESKWNKAFLSNGNKTEEETLDYVKCMTLTQTVDPNVYLFLTPNLIREIVDYIEKPMTATWFSDEKNKGGQKEIVTSELIYYWMIALGIPFECQKWHLNRLLTLIKVCNIKNQPAKKMSKSEILNRNRALNEARRRSLGSKG